MSSKSSLAAWLPLARAHPFELKETPQWQPQDNEILIRNHAVAINPVDHALQTQAWYPLDYPTILGQDVAGEVQAVGANVTRFAPGARVLGHAVGMSTKQAQHNAFQTHTVLQTNMATEIPDSMAYAAAAVIPLGLSTAAAGLFQPDFLGLPYPTEPRTAPRAQSLLIWGGASSVGCNAIQLAVAAGYEVVTTASAKNFEYVRQLGATEVFDYNCPTVIENIVRYFQDGGPAPLVGVMDCINFSATAFCVDVVRRVPAVERKFVVTVRENFPTPPDGVTVKSVFGLSIKDNPVGKAIYEDYLPKALEAGSFVPAPRPLVVGEGLESVQAAVDLYGRGGISAQKVVVLL
ncbi:zinc-binding alcohol dehydrogenase family protein [Aspergillus homomorphus CBS 101889]|uniref:Putative glucose-repressible alcohol dehydrogenase n=1 Tax=Aspergillus homomorphus (strain CBS 101889) TaxID=1450537 RepID=A0A395I7C0_ASPHC|nr:putative glucose-repressible alcohol dehydrogenase [Aspergillus homomorphus CBS 101889]RAL15183.1 putative glucose-repressible alcohol dehydrogenase [Aspergillus homomorphus CBS 101889]